MKRTPSKHGEHRQMFDRDSVCRRPALNRKPETSLVSGQRFSNLSLHWSTTGVREGCLWKCGSLGHTHPQPVRSGGWGPSICISEKSQKMPTCSPGTTLWEPQALAHSFRVLSYEALGKRLLLSPTLGSWKLFWIVNIVLWLLLLVYLKHSYFCSISRKALNIF